MIRRTVLLAISCVLALSVGVTSAVAWCNGPAPLAKPKAAGFGYGTHDWVLEHAIRQAGAEGDWVNVKTALWHTNDPDFYNTNRDLHLFRDKGPSRGGPQAVADQYYIAAQALRRGDKATASKALGIMAHYYTDSQQPYHTTNDAQKYNDGAQLLRARRRQVQPPLRRGHLLAHRGPRQARDGRSSALDIGLQGRAPGIQRAALGSPAQSAGRRAQEQRGPRNHRQGAEPGRQRPGGHHPHAVCGAQRVTGARERNQHGPRAGDRAASREDRSVHEQPSSRTVAARCAAYAKCYDAKGRIIEGARVYFYWPKAGGGTVKVTAYTNQYGVAHSWRSTSGLAIKKHRVKSVSSSSGASRSASTLFRVQR